MRVIITGGTGLIGRILSAGLVADGHDVVVLTRNTARRSKLESAVRLVKWDGKSADGWVAEADGADAIINLAGEGIADGRWTDARKRAIYESRVHAGQAVTQALSQVTNRPKVLIQSSAVGYYGSDRGNEVLTEHSSPGSDYLAHVCFDWEASTAGAEQLGVRRPVIRTGVVLSNEGGAWPKIVLPFKLFAGGPVGNGKQVWPWIHIDDEVRAIRFLLEHETASGPFNLTAPNPLTAKDFATELGKVMGRPAFFPAPAIALKTALGEMSTILLDGQRAVPARLQELGFSYKYPVAAEAFKTLV
jgi:uncharacterized protein